jgi:hypothetical protein
MGQLTYNGKVEGVVRQLAGALPEKEITLGGIHLYGTEKGYIESKHASWLGKLYKQTFQGDDYVHGNWWK